MWDINTGECLHVLMGHVAAVRCVQYDGRLVVSGAYDYMVIDLFFEVLCFVFGKTQNRPEPERLCLGRVWFGQHQDWVFRVWNSENQSFWGLPGSGFSGDFVHSTHYIYEKLILGNVYMS